MCYACVMSNHYVKWVEHNGTRGQRAFTPNTSRAKVEAYRKKMGRDARVKDAWIEWGTVPEPKRKGPEKRYRTQRKGK